MPPKVVFSQTSRRDLDGIYDYIYRESKSRRTARSFIEKIEKTAATFATQPNAGVDASDFIPKARFFVVGSYVAFYRPILNGIEVSRVLHGSMDLKRFFRSGDS